MCETREIEEEEEEGGAALTGRTRGSENTDEDIKICGEREAHSVIPHVGIAGKKSTLSSEQEVSSKCQPGKSTERLRQAGGQASNIGRYIYST